MSPVPAVRCCDCSFSWNSAAMAEGLRLLGSCPRCGGSLEFRGQTPDTAFEPAVPRRVSAQPHLVLGLPRR